MARQRGYTIPLTPRSDGERATIYQLDGQWYYCFRRVDPEGEEYDDESVGPFTTAEEAERRARAEYIPYVDVQ